MKQPVDESDKRVTDRTKLNVSVRPAADRLLFDDLWPTLATVTAVWSETEAKMRASVTLTIYLPSIVSNKHDKFGFHCNMRYLSLYFQR